MKINRVIIFLVLALTAVISFYLLQRTPAFRNMKPAVEQKPATEDASKREETAQTGEAERQDEEETEEEAPSIEISEEAQKMIGVKTVDVTARPFQQIIRTVGRVDYDEKRLATVNTKIEGWIEKLYVDYTGRYVSKGEPLAEIYSPELIATQQEYLNVLRWSKNEKDAPGTDIGRMLSRDSESLLDAARQRLMLWDITEKQIKKIEDSGRPLRTLTVYSPVSGYVVQKMALQGMRVMPGEKLFDLADLSFVWILSDIYEHELPLIKTGQSARISLSYFPGREFVSKVDYVYPTLSAETRTTKVRFTVPNPGTVLKPQMFTNVEVKVDLGKRLSIPDDAVIDTGLRQIVYVDRGEGYFEPREVRLGTRAGGVREVLEGLKEGERVASSATFLIDSEAKLKGITPLGGHKH